MTTLIDQIVKLQKETALAHASLIEKFKELSLDHKIDLYCLAGEQDSSGIFDSFLNSESYYHLSGVSLTDDLYWERYETMTLSDVFDFLLDETDDDTLFDPQAIAEYVKDGDSTAHKVFLDMLSNNIGRATYDW